MKVISIAECSLWSILQYFWPALSDNWSSKPFSVSLRVAVLHRFYCSVLFNSVFLTIVFSLFTFFLLQNNVQYIGPDKHVKCKILIDFLSVSLNVCFGCSLRTHNLFWLRNKKIILGFSVPILRPIHWEFFCWSDFFMWLCFIQSYTGDKYGNQNAKNRNHSLEDSSSPWDQAPR